MKTSTDSVYLQTSPLLDYEDVRIQKLLQERAWLSLDEIARCRAIYTFVRDEVVFGYNASDAIPASEVLESGYGQCNTKAILLMALLRAAGIPCRLHGFTIYKNLQKGAITGIWYWLSPREILHSWVEAKVKGDWYYLEGVILDARYLRKLQEMNPDCPPDFCGFGAFTEDFRSPVVDFNLNHTFIQEKGIARDFGLFDSPDAFYQSHRQNTGKVKDWLFRNWVRHRMNRNVERIRMG